MYQYVLNFVGLLDLDADTNRVDAGLDQDTLVLVSRNSQGLEEDFGGCLCLNLGDIVSLSGLRSEVGKRERSGQAAAYALQVRSEGLRLSGEVSCQLAVRFVKWQ